MLTEFENKPSVKSQQLHQRMYLTAAASVAVGLAITETWRYYSWQTLAWAWLAAPAVAAGFLTRLWPRMRQAWTSYTTVSRTRCPLHSIHCRCHCCHCLPAVRFLLAKAFVATHW